MVAQVFNLCMRRLKPAATQNYLMIATWYQMVTRFCAARQDNQADYAASLSTPLPDRV